MILLHYISRPGRLALFPEFQWSEQSLQASSPLSGKCTVIWCLDLLLAEDEGPKQDFSQKLCCFGQEGGRLSGAEDVAASEALWLSPVPETAGLCIPHPHPCSLPSAESWSQGHSRCRGLRHKPLGLADPCALTRKVAGCLEPKMAPPRKHFLKYFTSMMLVSS